jgi:hypothetical protein
MIHNSLYVWCSQGNLCCSNVFAIFRHVFVYLSRIVCLALRFCVPDVSEAHAASVFRVEMSRASIYSL